MLAAPQREIWWRGDGTDGEAAESRVMCAGVQSIKRKQAGRGRKRHKEQNCSGFISSRHKHVFDVHWSTPSRSRLCFFGSFQSPNCPFVVHLCPAIFCSLTVLCFLLSSASLSQLIHLFYLSRWIPCLVSSFMVRLFGDSVPQTLGFVCLPAFVSASSKLTFGPAFCLDWIWALWQNKQRQQTSPEQTLVEHMLCVH